MFGVAVDANVPLASIEQMRESHAEWTNAAGVVRSKFADLEAAQARTDRQELRRETPQPVVRVIALYRDARSPRSPLYFVAEKKYRTPSSPHDSSCARVSVMTGWLVPAPNGTLTLRHANVFLTDCDRKTARTAVPLAALHVSNHVFWVLQAFGYESETYLVAEIGPADVRYAIQADGGGC